MSETKNERFEVWQNGMLVASVSGPNRGLSRMEIFHYACQYAEDGPIEIKGLTDADRLEMSGGRTSDATEFNRLWYKRKLPHSVTVEEIVEVLENIAFMARSPVTMQEAARSLLAKLKGE